MAVVIKPDASSQPWEGLQGADSISPPFLLPDNTCRTFAAFYGSAGSLGQRNGLVTASELGGSSRAGCPRRWSTSTQRHASQWTALERF